jgi:hypothetical protein
MYPPRVLVHFVSELSFTPRLQPGVEKVTYESNEPFQRLGVGQMIVARGKTVKTFNKFKLERWHRAKAAV